MPYYFVRKGSPKTFGRRSLFDQAQSQKIFIFPTLLEAFLLALHDVATAHGFANVAKKSDLGRESLYKALSKSGNPKIETLSTLLKTMGLKLSVEAKVVKRKRAS